MQKIYTKKGDFGTTCLFDGKKVFKFHQKIKLLGSLDELNSLIGFIESSSEKVFLEKIQNIIFELNSFIANGRKIEEREYFLKKINEITKEMEKHIDEMTEKLPELKNFILPNGTQNSLFSHLARTKSRKVEQELVEFVFGSKNNLFENFDHKKRKEKEFFKKIIPMINRFSDYFFTLARYENFEEKVPETIWKKEI